MTDVENELKTIKKNQKEQFVYNIKKIKNPVFYAVKHGVFEG